MDKWERRREIMKRRRNQEIKEQNERAEIRPLRNAVNQALKKAGIPHSVTHYSSIVKGWPISTSEGWETESMYWSNPRYIRVSICGYHDSFHNNEKREQELRALAEKALEAFVYEKDGKYYKVTAVK